ncbi:hypothetical protein SCA6_020509 [Theobroma cacao]
MSLAVGEDSSSKSMGFDKDGRDDSEASETKTEPKTPPNEGDVVEHHPAIARKASESSLCPTEDEDDDEERKIELGPQFTLKEQLEKDKDDESLRRWKEQLLGTVDFESVGETLEPDVKILSLAIKSPGRPDMVLPIPEDGKPKGLWFTLKEGSKYSLQFSFQVSNNIVSGLKYTNTVWKTGVKVDSTKEMLGTFSPQAEPYTHEMPEETTPSGMFARGSYSARSKALQSFSLKTKRKKRGKCIFAIQFHYQSVLILSPSSVMAPNQSFQFADDDNKSYLEINYTFDIRKEWQS